MNNNFNVWYPYENFDPSSKHFFFFFNSLEEQKDTTNSANQKSGADLYRQVKDYLYGNLNNFSPSTNEGLEKIKNVLSFLQRTIEYERAQEIAYYKKYFDRTELTPELKKIFSTVFNPESPQSKFDYTKFINIINILHMGADKYKTVLSYEINRLDQLQDMIDQFLTLPENEQWIKSTVTNEESEDKGFYANFNNYLKIQGKHSLISTKTISNALQAKMVETIPEIWNSKEWKELIASKLKQMAFKKTVNNDIIMILSAELLNLAMPAIEDAAFKQLKEKSFNTSYNFNKVVLDKNKLKEVVTFEAKQYLDTITLTSDKTAVHRLITKLEKQTANDTINLDNDTKRFLQWVIPITEGKNKNGEEIIKIADSTEKILKGLIKDKGKIPQKRREDIIQQFLDLYGDPSNYDIINNKWNLSYVKELISSQLKGKTEPYIRFHIASKDNLESEIFAASNNDYLINKTEEVFIQKIDLAGGYQKADTYGIINEELGTLILNLDEGKLSNRMIALCDNITKSYMDSIEIQPKNQVIKIGKTILFDEQKFRKSNGFSEKEFSIEAETKRRLAYLKKRILNLRQKLKDEGATTQKIEEAVQLLKNTVQISSTVKSYNKYNNKTGFHGGSLGGTVERQLDNIMQMYSYGGITIGDKDWLTLAVYNSGPDMVGSDLKTPLENIFSTIAGMLLFDDAGEQALYIQSKLDSTITTGSSNFLHLYNLNNVFLPSSYVLQLTYNHLVKIYGILDAEFNKFKNQSITPAGSKTEGAKITIENNVKESEYSTDWNNFFQENKKNVSLNIVFLAGFLDIIKEINKAMSEQ